MLAHCIHLPQVPHRKQWAAEQFSREGVTVLWWEGVHAKSFGLHTLLPYMDDQPHWKPEDGPPYRISQGQVGCFLSHWTLWNALLWQPEEWFLICEDDIELVPQFVSKVDAALSAAPEWDYLFFGHCCLSVGERLRGGWVRPTHPPYCTHCYCVKKTALPTLIATNRICYTHVDIQIAKRSLPHLRYFAADPPLTAQVSTQPDKRLQWSTTLE